MKKLVTVIGATYRGGYSIELTFSDGLQRTVDFECWLYGPVFEPLREQTYFKRFSLEGGTIAWPNGADVAPETLYAQACAN